MPSRRISLTKPNLGFVLLWIFCLEHEERVHVIYGVLHDCHFLIGEPGKTLATPTSRTRLSSMDVFNRSVSERQRDYGFRSPRDLLAPDIRFHVRRFLPQVFICGPAPPRSSQTPWATCCLNVEGSDKHPFQVAEFLLVQNPIPCGNALSCCSSASGFLSVGNNGAFAAGHI
jgi:hypothetical protein